MTQSLTMLINLFAYSDAQKSNNPALRDFDYARRIIDVPTSKTRSQQHIVNVGEQEIVLSMQRALTNGASWTMTNPTGVTSRYSWTGANPVLRTERTSGLTGGATVDVTRLASSKVVRLSFSGNPGTGIQAGDEIWLGPDSGVTAINQGIWPVVAANSGANTVDVISDSMVNEAGVVITDVTDVYAFSSGPVRLGDFLKVSSTSFNFGNQGEFQITRVTSRWVEVQNTDLVPEGPITADIVIYDQLYKLTYIETDQRVNLYINNANQPVVIEPIQEGEPGMIGVYLVRGPVFSVEIENVGHNAANVTTFFAT